MIKHYVNLDVSKREPRRVIPISLGDNAVHKIIFTLSNGSEIIELPAYCNASVCVRNGGYGDIDTATVDDNTVIYEPSITSTYKKGNVACDLIIADRNNRKLYAPVFYLYIDEDFSENIEKELNEALENHEAWAIITQTANNADIAETSAQNAQTHAENAEAWAVGEKNGIALTNGDQYENNAKYYAEQAHIWADGYNLDGEKVQSENNANYWYEQAKELVENMGENIRNEVQDDILQTLEDIRAIQNQYIGGGGYATDYADGGD